MFRIIRSKKIQPIDLKKKLATAMRDERRILPYGDYAPNRYVVFLNREDASRWAALKSKAIEQLKTFLREQIDKEGYQLEGDISIEIQASEDLAPGGVSVEAGLEVAHTYQQSCPPDETRSTRENINDKLSSNPPAEENGVDNNTIEILTPGTTSRDVKLIEPGQEERPKAENELPQDDEELPLVPADMAVETAEAEDGEEMTFRLPRMAPIAKLIVTKGEDAGKEFALHQTRVVVGRRGKKADISLTDSSKYISRQQFEMVYDEGIFILTDLQNRLDLHVCVNDNKAAPSIILNTKDKISLGNDKLTIVEMEFVVL